MNKKPEKKIEDDFVLFARTLGVKAIKFIDPSNTGAPDRMVLMPGGQVLFIEFKAPGEGPDPKQVQYHKELRDLGFKVFVADSFVYATEVLVNAITKRVQSSV